MSIGDDEFEVMWDSDEFRACETMAQQETPLEVAVLRLIDFYGMCEEEARSYYFEALQENKNREGKRSKELQEMEQEEFDQEPSLDKLMPELLSSKNADKAKAFFADIKASRAARQAAQVEDEEQVDGERMGTLRRLQARQRSEAFLAQSRASSKSQSDTPEKTASTSKDTPSSSK